MKIMSFWVSVGVSIYSASSLVLPFFYFHMLGKFLTSQNSQTHLSLTCLEVA